MATTEVAVLARIEAAAEALGYRVMDDLEFVRQPSSVTNQTVTVSYNVGTPVGGFGLTEEARGTVLVSVVRAIQNDYGVAKAALYADGRALYSAIVRDGAVTSGEYAVEDGGQTFAIEAPRGTNYLIGRLRVPINFEAVLTAS